MPLVKDLMVQDIVTADQHMTVHDVAILMNDHKVGCVVIKEGKVPVGIVTERDFVRRVIVKKRSVNIEVGEIMSTPLRFVDPDASLREAARVMVTYKIRRLPVVKDGKLVGILASADFARQLSKKSITEQILEAIARYPPRYEY